MKVLTWIMAAIDSCWEFCKLMVLVALNELGMTSFREVLDQIFFLKYKFLAAHLSGFSFISGLLISSPVMIDWVSIYVFSPKIILFVCLSTTVAEWLSGIIKAVFHDHERFDLTKGASIIPKFLSQLWALSTSFHFGSNEPIMAWLPATVAIFLFSYNFIKASYNLSHFGWLPDGFTEFLQKQFKLHSPAKKEPEPTPQP
jgi:hypothetical protein